LALCFNICAHESKKENSTNFYYDTRTSVSNLN
jgi:hypothetical protein